MARQAILDREDPPLLWAVADDAVLTRCVGSPEITSEALLHLAKMARRPNIVVQVLDGPGAHVGLQGAFTIAEVAGTAGSVNIDDITDGRVSSDAATIAEVSVRFRWLQSEALPAGVSLELIERWAEAWKHKPKDGARRLTAVPAVDSASS
jgi:Domain of unknown function (DUF5753)